MIDSHHVLTAATPGGLVVVGAGWPSPTAWPIAGVALGLLALIARWASRRHTARTADVRPGAASGQRQPTTPTQRRHPRPTQTREEQP